jgi:hypothetical protein
LCEFINTVLSEAWELDGFSLLDFTNGSATDSDNKGLLILTMTEKNTGLKRNGTLCQDNFSGQSAHVICQSIGYMLAEWGSYLGKMNNSTKLDDYE